MQCKLRSIHYLVKQEGPGWQFQVDPGTWLHCEQIAFCLTTPCQLPPRSRKALSEKVVLRCLGSGQQPPPSTTILTPGQIWWPGGQGGAVAQANTAPTTLVIPKRILEAAGLAGWPHSHRFLHPSWEKSSPWSSSVCWQCGAPLFSSEWDSCLEITKITNDTVIKILL